MKENEKNKVSRMGLLKGIVDWGYLEELGWKTCKSRFQNGTIRTKSETSHGGVVMNWFHWGNYKGADEAVAFNDSLKGKVYLDGVRNYICNESGYNTSHRDWTSIDYGDEFAEDSQYLYIRRFTDLVVLSRVEKDLISNIDLEDFLNKCEFGDLEHLKQGSKVYEN